MKKETLLEIVLATIGGIIFSIGMCMCLIKEWNLFNLGVIVTIIGFIILILIIPVYKNSHPKKQNKVINNGIVITWIVGIIGALVMGFGMSKVMIGNTTRTDMIIGLVAGVVGLITCVLNYPLYSFFYKKNIIIKETKC